MNTDILVTIASIVATLASMGVFGFIWKCNRVINRILNLLKDYPLHGHDADGNPYYPPDYPPAIRRARIVDYR